MEKPQPKNQAQRHKEKRGMLTRAGNSTDSLNAAQMQTTNTANERKLGHHLLAEISEIGGGGEMVR